MAVFDLLGFKRSSQKAQANQRDSNLKPKKTTEKVIEKRKILASRLRVGMTVVELDRPWTEVPVMFQELKISTQNEIHLLQKYCQHVFIDAQSYRTYYKTIVEFDNQKVIYPKLDLRPTQASQFLREELKKVKTTFDRSYSHIYQLMKDVQRDSQIDIEGSKDLVSQTVDSILRNETAMFWLSKIKHQDEYTSEHCVRVGILAIAFGKHLQLPRENLEVLGMCGMLHDVGKMKVRQDILNKPASLSPEEFAEVKKHTVLGYDFLKQHGGVDEQICAVARNHHERMNGDGYPRNVESQLLSLYDRIIAIVDSYDAMTSDRCYHKGIPASQALSILYKEQTNHYDAELVQQFIHMVGIYPVGSLVQMNNGQLALILSVNEEHKLEPVVELLTDTEGRRIQPIASDLSKHPTDTAGNILRIKKALADSEVDFCYESYIKDVV
ncbi:HD-GYP domain-containing protein [Kangiella koreensis]|uniref:Metal dependent phosphohydrolase n=1 Tax=Kangiella koreensis (strain DSM 16069 / JCM 12317 / KCTC 12182 / SW-125) TaxID=523791 RepID=C7R7F8_KANKD|nr:HD-GYP domain-containing protein [Kangiella koreensis]ACV25707.1 metal dependent phosphohydrolase [Kangiella koreensis DSM 16069]